MAPSMRLAVRSPKVLRACNLTPFSSPARPFVTLGGIASPRLSNQHSCQIVQPRRSFKSSTAWRITEQEAPSAQAYLASGAIAGSKNLVDVKKVLVIGSGGLSIGQAGEFDYSGESESCRCCGLSFCNQVPSHIVQEDLPLALGCSLSRSCRTHSLQALRR